MAKKKRELKHNGEGFYPTTIVGAVADERFKVPLASMFSEYNLSALCPTFGYKSDGTLGGDLYDLARAIEVLIAQVGALQIKQGDVLVFKDKDREGATTRWEFQGGLLDDIDAWRDVSSHSFVSRVEYRYLHATGFACTGTGNNGHGFTGVDVGPQITNQTIVAWVSNYRTEALFGVIELSSGSARLVIGNYNYCSVHINGSSVFTTVNLPGHVNKLQCIAMVVNNEMVSIYVNGVKRIERSIPTVTLPNTRKVEFKTKTSQAVKAYRMSIYSTALTQQDIEDIYNGGNMRQSNAPREHLIAEYLPSNITNDGWLDSVGGFNLVKGLNIIPVFDCEYQDVIQGVAAPSIVPDFVGQKFVNITTGDVYISNGTTTANNWIQC